MKWGFLDFSIKNRIQLGVSAFLLAIVVLGAASVFYLREIQKNAESIFTRNYVILEKSQRFAQYTHQFRASWLNFSSGAVSNQMAIRKLYPGIYEMDSILIDQRHLAGGEVEPELMDSVQVALNQFKADFKKIRFVGTFDTTAISALLLADLDRMIQVNDQLAEILRADVLSRYDTTKQTVNRVITTMIILTISLSAFGFLLLWIGFWSRLSGFQRSFE